MRLFYRRCISSINLSNEQRIPTVSLEISLIGGIVVAGNANGGGYGMARFNFTVPDVMRTFRETYADSRQLGRTGDVMFATDMVIVSEVCLMVYDHRVQLALKIDDPAHCAKGGDLYLLLGETSNEVRTLSDQSVQYWMVIVGNRASDEEKEQARHQLNDTVHEILRQLDSCFEPADGEIALAMLELQCPTPHSVAVPYCH